MFDVLISKDRVVAGSFAQGYRVVPPPVRHGEDDVLATAMWLERHGDSEGGLALIDNWVAGRQHH